MSDSDMQAPGAQVRAAPGAGHREPLVLQHEDAVVVVERLRETHVDTTGHAFLLKLDTLIVRLGAKWEQKCDLVFDHLKSGFERQFEEPNWCIGVNGDSWMALIPTAGSRKGALAVAEMWRELCNFFVGDMSDIEVPLYDIRVEDVDRFSIRKIDLKAWFDAPDDEQGPVKARGGAFATPGAAEGEGGTANKSQRPVMVAATVTYAGRSLKIASSVEPLFEMKKMAMIGHRLEGLVMENLDNTLLDRKALANLDWGLREQLDVVNIEQGLRLLRLRSAEQRKMLMVVPAAFSTFASNRARTKITQDVAKASAEMGLKVLFEIRGLDGVPPHRVLEIVSMIKPFCMTAVGNVSAERKAITSLSKCGLSGVCVEYDGLKREEDALKEYLSNLSAAAKSSAGACMVQGFDNYRQMAVARLAGVTHASIKAAALISPRMAVGLAKSAAEGIRGAENAGAEL